MMTLYYKYLTVNGGISMIEPTFTLDDILMVLSINDQQQRQQQ